MSTLSVNAKGMDASINNNNNNNNNSSSEIQRIIITITILIKNTVTRKKITRKTKVLV